MTWWFILYLVLYAALAVAGLWDDYCDHRPAWFFGLAVLSNVTIVYLFVAFWYPVLRTPLGIVAPTAFVAAICWEVFQAVEDIRGLAPDSELTETQQRVVAAITTVTLPILCVPAFVVAGITAFRS